MNFSKQIQHDSDIVRAGARQMDSRIAKFYKLSLQQRLDRLEDDGYLSPGRRKQLESHTEHRIADSMIENAIGTLEIPLGLGLNFTINGSDYIVPMATEEPSVIAAVSHGAKTVRQAGGFDASVENSQMIGQIQLVACPDFQEAKSNIRENSDRLLERANAAQPSMRKRGGGAQQLEVRHIDEGEYREMLVIHLMIDPCDAMGANTVNSMAEALAPELERLTDGSAVLRILSNLADRSIVEARCEISLQTLDWKNHEGEDIARGIELASEFAEADPYRAATHNKGIMNGVDAVCLATGNDWRAMEAGAHSFSGLGSGYEPLATWSIEDDHLSGKLRLPTQLGTVGGTIRQRPTVEMVYELMDIDSADELSRVIGAVGLAQNLSALRALATDGIQEGHMRLHARSVAAMAGANREERQALVEQLLNQESITVESASELLQQFRKSQ